MREEISRRDFLNRLAKLGLVAGGIGISLPLLGCGSEATTPADSPSPVAQPTAAAGATQAQPNTTPVSQPTPAQATSTTVPRVSPTTSAGAAVTQGVPTAAPTAVQVSDVADLAVVKGTDAGVAVRAAVLAVGGIERFVARGSKVVVKPNIGFSRSPEYAATTNPEVVAVVIALCREAGAAKVTVLDNGVSSANVGYERSGIEAAAKQAGATVERISNMKFKQVEVPKAKEMRSLHVYQDVLEADVIISVPIAKHHNLAGLTIGMKNMMGVVRDRSPFHNNIGQRVADLCTLTRPALTVVDATRILLRNGPSGGSLSDVKKLDTIIASADIVAADSYATTLFGMKGQDLPTARAGEAMGLGTTDLGKLHIATVSV